MGKRFDRGGLSGRWRVADDWQQMLASAEAGPVRGRLRIPPMSRRIAAARPAIEQLTATLYSPEPVDPRGVAMARHLLRDGTGPVYHPRAERTLTAAVEDCVDALDPTNGCQAACGPSDHAARRGHGLRSRRLPRPAARRSARDRRR